MRLSYQRGLACLLLGCCLLAGLRFPAQAVSQKALVSKEAPPPLTVPRLGGQTAGTARLYAYPVSIPMELQARNYNFHCVWCCLQTVARHQHVTPLVDILREVDRDPATAKNGVVYFDKVHNLLVTKKVAHYYQPRGYHDLAEVRKSLKKGVGVIVSLRNPKGVSYSHAVILAGLWRDWVSYYDPDDVTQVWDMPRQEFRRRWNGTALFLDYLVPSLPTPSTPVSTRILVADLTAKKGS